MPDGGTVQTKPVTPAEHKETCPYCITALPGAAACVDLLEAKAAWRRSVREAGLNRAPLDCAAADGGNGQITTEDATR